MPGLFPTWSKTLLRAILLPLTRKKPPNRIFIVSFKHVHTFFLVPVCHDPAPLRPPLSPSIIAMKLSAKPTKPHHIYIYTPLGCPFDKLSSRMKWQGYWGRLGPCLERSSHEVSSWHTGGSKTSNHGWKGGWESRLRGETPVGGR